MKKYYIYTNENLPKFLDFVRVLKREQLQEAFVGYDPQKHIAIEESFTNPILDNSNIREMTDTEMAENGVRELREGEKIINGKLIRVEAPNKLHSWNKKSQTWEFDIVKEELELDNIRVERDKRIAETDYTMFPDVPLTSDKKIEIEGYRQALRDVPQNTTDVLNPTWPQKPTWIK